MNKQRKPPGRKAEVTGLKRINVCLDPVTVAKAKKIGGGNNVSLGLRRAVNSAKLVGIIIKDGAVVGEWDIPPPSLKRLKG